MTTNVELAGFVIRDTISYLFGSGFPKSHNIQKHILKELENELKEKYNTTKVVWR
jgi:hypothetical protein